MVFQSVSFLLPVFLLFAMPETLSQITGSSAGHDLSGVEKEYQLVWSDEFDEEGFPDPKKWTFERGFIRNKELQYYQPENASCKDGLLVIEARTERATNTQFVSGGKDWQQRRRYAQYTSACMTTRGLHSWKFARIEVRARIDAREGLWPAIWTVGDSGPWPDCGEIDIMEYYQGQLLANACWSSGVPWKPKWEAVKKPLSALGDTDWATKFHTWRMDWNKHRIELFVDDRLLNSIDVDKTAEANKQNRNPFHQPHHLLLNLAVGGSQGGDPSETDFPATFEVDYVRVYQR